MSFVDGGSLGQTGKCRLSFTILRTEVATDFRALFWSASGPYLRRLSGPEGWQTVCGIEIADMLVGGFDGFGDRARGRYGNEAMGGCYYPRVY